MRRLVDRWWLVGSALLVAVIVLTYGLYVGEVHHQQQRTAQRQAASVLGQSVRPTTRQPPLATTHPLPPRVRRDAPQADGSPHLRRHP
jgi:hypothetical protein